MFVADEQIGCDAGQFPEDEEHQQVARKDQAQHGAHKEQQIGIEAAEVTVTCQIAARIDEHQRTDAADQQAKEQTQAVYLVGEIDIQRRRPRPLALNALAGRDAWLQAQQPNKDGQRNQGKQPAYDICSVELHRLGYRQVFLYERHDLPNLCSTSIVSPHQQATKKPTWPEYGTHIGLRCNLSSACARLSRT